MKNIKQMHGIEAAAKRALELQSKLNAIASQQRCAIVTRAADIEAPQTGRRDCTDARACNGDNDHRSRGAGRGYSRDLHAHTGTSNVRRAMCDPSQTPVLSGIASPASMRLSDADLDDAVEQSKPKKKKNKKKEDDITFKSFE